MYPLKFDPILKTKVWGGEKIAKFKNITTDLHGIGESWEVSAYTGEDSVVSEGPLAGKTLTELVSEYKGKLVGEHVYAENGNAKASKASPRSPVIRPARTSSANFST